MNSVLVFTFAFLIGVGLVLVWLWFWLKQDHESPEPWIRLLLTFLGGMAIVPFAFPLEASLLHIYDISLGVIFLSWSAIEELGKLLAASLFGLTSYAMDEPIDALIYLITAALGFAALENALFLYEPIAFGNLGDTLIAANMRFIGANLLHITSSAIIGTSIALAFYKTRTIKIIYIFIGIILAIALHTAFNFFIIKSGTEQLLLIFGFVWIGIVGLIFVFQRIKYLEYKHNHNK